MRKITIVFSFFILFILTSIVVGQTPTFFNTNSVANGNSFPLGTGSVSASGRKVQWFIPANNLGAVPPVCSITVVYFQASTSATVSYPSITLKLKAGTGTGLTSSAGQPMVSGMDLVFTGTNYSIASTVGSWIGFSLTTPYAYNPTLPLIVELGHNANSFNNPSVLGPYLCNAVNIPGPGNGRQFCDFSATTIAGVGSQQVNFGIDVITIPCTGSPTSNTILPLSYSTCPSLVNPSLSLANSYSVGDITYQWQSSTSQSGPFNSIPGATMTSAPVPNLTVSTWYQVVATCSNTGGQTTITPTGYIVGPSVTSTVPYFESFEYILDNNRLPNCSWFAGNLGSSVTTYTSPQSSNRVPRSGNRFATFGLPSTNNTVYSNGLQLKAGVTYSAALWYATEYFGYTNWTNLSILVGTNQSGSGLTTIASVGPAMSGAYKLLSGTFTVPSTGTYYIAVRANSSSGSAAYLSWDDLSVTIPCSGPGSANSPTLNLSANNTTVCSGDIVNLAVNGANSYTWSTGIVSANISDALITSQTYTVSGTNTLTGCTSDTTLFIKVNPAPNVLAFANSPSVCVGQSVNITALGANSYLWSNGYTTSIINVSPSVTTIYTVTGVTQNSCTSSSEQTITVMPLPILTISSNQTVGCTGDLIALNASGTDIYTWSTGTTSANISDTPLASQTYTVWGTNTLTGCAGVSTQYIKINPSPTVLMFANSPSVCVGQSVNITALGANSYLWSNGYTTSIINVSPSVTTIYTVTGVTQNSCTSSSEQTITVMPLPILTISSNQTVGCTGDLIALNASGTDIYTWSTGTTSANISDTPLASQTYTVWGTNTLTGCAGVSTQYIKINPSPTVLMFANSPSVCVGQSVNITALGANSYLWSNGYTTSIINVSPSVTTIYTVTGVTQNSCASSSEQTITVMPLPVISTASNQIAGCVGDPAVLSATGAITYHWLSGTTGLLFQGNPITVILSTSTIYTVSGTDANGCVGEAIQQVVVYPAPVISVSSSKTNPCKGEEVVLTVFSAGGSNYTWLSSIASNTFQGSSITIVASNSEIYTITGINANGCLGTSQYVQFVEECTGITNVSGTNGIPALYPNPTTGVFTIDLSDNSFYNTELLDLSGRIITVISHASNKTEMDISHLANGLYYLKIIADNYVKVIKLIKQ